MKDKDIYTCKEDRVKKRETDEIERRIKER